MTTVKKFQISMKTEILEKVDQFAKENGMSRSGLLQIAVVQYMNAQESLPSLNKTMALLGTLAQQAAAGGVDRAEYDKTLAELEHQQKELFPAKDV